MKKCPNCNSELESNFDVCWNCNYSLSEEKIVEFEDELLPNKKIDCLRCKVPMVFSGNYRFHEGTRLGVFGDLMEIFENRESFDLFSCPDCGKVEFFLPNFKKE